jgi:hypothetical protein
MAGWVTGTVHDIVTRICLNECVFGADAASRGRALMAETQRAAHGPRCIDS